MMFFWKGKEMLHIYVSLLLYSCISIMYGILDTELMMINSTEIIMILIIYLRIFIFRIIDPTINWDNLANVTQNKRFIFFDILIYSLIVQVRRIRYNFSNIIRSLHLQENACARREWTMSLTRVPGARLSFRMNLRVTLLCSSVPSVVSEPNSAAILRTCV